MTIVKCRICEQPFIPPEYFTPQDKFNDQGCCPACNERARQNSNWQNNQFNNQLKG